MKALRSRRALLLLSVAGVAGAGVAAASSPAVAPAVLAWRQTHAVHTTATTGALKVAAATPKAHCGKGSLPETGIQGRVPLADYSNGRAAKGYLCNAVEASHIGTTGGFKTFRYTDRTGRVCAFYDGTLLFPTAAVHGEAGGVHVLDMSDPNRPVETARLLTPAMDSPHESLALNPLRGLLAAGMGSPATAPGIVDVYDVSQDCRHPVLQSSTPLGILGHESGFSPDGRTLWISTTAQPGVTAIDVSNPVLPSIVWHSFSYTFHGMNLSADGNRLYGADLGNSGLAILDVSQVQRRVANPQVTEVSHLTWPEVSIPQNTIPVTIKGHKYLVEFDEYARGASSTDPSMPVGAGRIINIDDDRHPRVVSNLRLQVNQPAARAGDQVNDPGQYPVQGYAAHYCGVPRTTDPGIVACSFILSGLRVFDISDPLHPKEAAYFNKPAPNLLPLTSGAYAMSAPSFDIKRQSVWY
ncbi:MAG: LVIVD repeat-containing protein, partial [Mycobacteriales bacterium]